MLSHSSFLKCASLSPIALTWLVAPTAFAQTNLADTIAKCEDSVVRIEVSGLKGDGLGSGFVVSSSGMLVTNVHVLEGAERAIAFFKDDSAFEIEGTYFIDENRDICVAKISGKRFKAIELSDSLPRKGEQVVALGSPQGLSFSATRGIVSAVRSEEEARRQIGRPNIKGTWIQVDAPLSGGNSGGPLINERGQVVGMSTLASQGAAQNLNFGISIEDIREGIEKAKSVSLVALKDGIAKADMGEVVPESGEMINRGTIPSAALQVYIDRGRRRYSSLAKALKKSATEAAEVLRGMRSGETYIPGGGGNLEYVVQKGRS